MNNSSAHVNASMFGEIPQFICKELEYNLSLDAIDFALLSLGYILIIYINCIALFVTLMADRSHNIYYLLLCSNYISNLIGGSAYFGNEYIGIKRHLYSTCFKHLFGFIQIFALCNVLTIVAFMSFLHLRAVRKLYYTQTSQDSQFRKRLKMAVVFVWISNAIWAVSSYACDESLPYLSSIFRYVPFAVPHIVIIVCYVWTFLLLRQRIDDDDLDRQESVKSIRFAKNLVIYIFMTFIIATFLITLANLLLVLRQHHTLPSIKSLVWTQRLGYMLFFSTEPVVFFVKDGKARKYIVCCLLVQTCKSKNRVAPSSISTTSEQLPSFHEVTISNSVT